MHGSICRAPPASVKPSIDSTPTRYIHDADPVYHVHPPRPRWAGDEYTSAATTQGSARYRATAAGVRDLLAGLIIANRPIALSPSPTQAKAMTLPSAAWVYCPPFSRTPGT